MTKNTYLPTSQKCATSSKFICRIIRPKIVLDTLWGLISRLKMFCLFSDILTDLYPHLKKTKAEFWNFYIVFLQIWDFSCGFLANNLADRPNISVKNILWRNWWPLWIHLVGFTSRRSIKIFPKNFSCKNSLKTKIPA